MTQQDNTPKPRQASLQRETAETAIQVSVNLDGQGQYQVDTGNGFLEIGRAHV